MKIIDENNHRSPLFRDTSFIGRLHEEGVLDTKEYLKLEDGLWELFESYGTEVPKESIIRFGIMTTFVLKSIIHHENENDGYEVKNVSKSDLHNLMERMNQVLEGLSDANMPNRNYLPGLPNA